MIDKEAVFKTEEEILMKGDLVMCREYGLSPNGNPLNGVWVIRNRKTGQYIDHDRYSNDLKERHDFHPNVS
ncbi:hypothetical protein AVT69_gp119 [Pseudomonas phage PhiPA3]|uniref:Uncharacterized protein 120 n=1 Tax=Pseudomonas phage PhiPA3 TaxID=998086 RepID=F8SJZ4_BPPA3|nr:hypothetical protein AVT69_gp119 [Pseudomonas phage PhiPA3]AEH03544.1 hypothetical protein [Pseudomonas phage PhiPA3]